MYKSMTRLSTLKFATNTGLTFPLRNPERTQFCRRSSGLLQKKEEAVMLGKEELCFATFLHNRREQAKRSFMVRLYDTNNINVLSNLFRVCNNCGKIENIFRYVNNSSEYLLIEMNSQNSLNSVMEHLYEIELGTACSEQFIVLSDFWVIKNKLPRKFLEKERTITGRDIINVKDVNKSSFLDREINKNAVSLNELISNCFHGLKVSDFEIRKKFLMCRQIEVMCSGFLPNVTAYPFGSSVTGFGTTGCDLDISLILNSKHYTTLYAQENSVMASVLAREHLEIISVVMKKFMTGCENLFFIRGAKVPIVKYTSMFTNVDCDLSLYNTHGIAVSQILYSLASFDWRIRALVIFIKFWALKVGIVYKSPGQRLSSFSLSLLVIFFLQQINMLPPWNIFPCSNSLYQMSESRGLSTLCTFIKERTQDDKSVEDLFLLFLEFYESFDFKQNGISLREGKVIKNTNAFPLFIENPIFQNLNVSANVTGHMISKTQKTFSEALDIFSKNKINSVQDLFSLKLLETRKTAVKE